MRFNSLILLSSVAVLLLLASTTIEAKKPTGAFIVGSLPEQPSSDSTRYKRYLKLTRLGYEGGEVERALSEEHGDVDGASYRLSREYSGYHGLHCLSRGNCFGDARRTVFREPADTSVIARPPPLQDLPDLTPEQEAKRLAAGPTPDAPKQQRQKPKPVGIDYSQQILETQLPKLDPFQRIVNTPVEIPHDRAVSAIRRKRGPTAQNDNFTTLMRKWITTIRAPWHTKKPGSMHQSERDNPELPKDTHQQIVPAIMEKSPDGKTIISRYFQPAHSTTMTLQQIEAKQAEEKEDAERLALERQHVVLDGRGGFTSTLHPPAPVTLPVPGADAPSDAALTPAQQQEQELVAAGGF